MNNQEAEQLLIKLSEHYREPVMPVSKYCDALRTWADCIHQNLKELDEDKKYKLEDLARSIRRVRTAISKSNFLYRLIYLQEKLRTKKCPVHKTYSGLAGPNYNCAHGCGLTGWIPDDIDVVIVPEKPEPAFIGNPIKAGQSVRSNEIGPIPTHNANKLGILTSNVDRLGNVNVKWDDGSEEVLDCAYLILLPNIKKDK